MNISKPMCMRLASAGLLVATTMSPQAQLTINVGTIELLPDRPDQTITLQVSGVTEAAALDFYVQIADGFPDLPGSVVNGPNITSVDIVTGTLFASNNDGGQFGSGSGLQHQYRGVLTASGTVSGSMLLATLIVDTTGFSGGTWSLNIKDVFNGPTTFYNANFDPIPATITDGFITVVPEPSTYGSVAGILLLVLTVAHRTGSAVGRGRAKTSTTPSFSRDGA